MSVIGDASFARRAVFRLSLIEFWERYSFYTTFALLALFVAAPVTGGGMGWSNGESLRFFGTYLLAVQATPILGGWLADRWLGKGAALRIGAGALAIGHVLLAIAAGVPWLHVGGESLAAVVARSGSGLGHWLAPAALPAAAIESYRWTTLAFYTAVAAIAIGNGLFKPILTVVVGRLPFASEAERTAAFTTFFVYINVGGLVSILLGGWLAQRFGWSVAFGGSALGMLAAIVTMSLLDQVYLRPFLGAAPLPASAAGTETPPADGHPRYVAAIGLLLVLLVVSSSFSFQSYGFVSLFTSQLVARDVVGFTIPASWFTALNPVTIMLLSPVLLSQWRRGGPGSNWTPVQQFAVALILMACAFVPLVAAARQATGGALASPAWVAATLVLIAASELIYAPAGLAASTRLAPARFQTVAIGLQGAAIGFGAWVSGQLGAAAFEYDKAAVMSGAAVAAVGVGVALWCARPLARRFGL